MRVGLSEYARHRKVTRKAVYAALRSGAIVVEADGQLDVAACDAAWLANIAPEPTSLKRARGVIDGGGVDADATGQETRNAADTRKAIAAAGLAELALAQKRGELVSVVDVQRLWYGLVRATRDRLLGLPDRISADLAAQADQHEVRVYLDRELRGALAELTEPESESV